MLNIHTQLPATGEGNLPDLRPVYSTVLLFVRKTVVSFTGKGSKDMHGVSGSTFDGECRGVGPNFKCIPRQLILIRYLTPARAKNELTPV